MATAVDDRIAAVEAELRELRQQQRRELVAAIAGLVGPRVMFSAGELWAHRAVSPALATAFDDAGIRNARQLGKRLRQLRGHGLERLGADNCGAIWIVIGP